MDSSALIRAFAEPREYFSAADRQRILSGSAFHEYLEEVKAVGEARLAANPGLLSYSLFSRYDTDGNRSEYERLYFERRGRLATFGLLSWLYGEEKYINALNDAIWAILDEYTWALPAHLFGKSLTRLETEGYTIDLFAAETASALSEILYLCGDRLAPIVVARARQMIRQRVLNRYLEADFNWEHMLNNWSAVCAGAVGIAALYEAETPDLRARIVEKLEPAMQTYLSSFPEDGVSLEGLGYWYYGFSFFTAYADMLRVASSGLINWFDDPRVRRIANFQQKMYFDSKNSVLFSDSGHSSFSRWWGLTSRLKQIYPEVEFPPLPRLGSFDSDSCYRWISILRELCWADERFSYSPASRRSWVLEDAQWLLVNGAHISAAAKGGHNAESHNHNDVGSFELFKDGEELLIDYGAGVYSRDYFNEHRYEHFVCSSLSHSVPVIEGLPQSPGREHAAAAVRMGEWFIEMELKDAYDDPNLRSFKRRLSFDAAKERFEICDEFSFNSPCTALRERFVSFAQPVLQAGKLLIRGKTAQCAISYDASALRFEASQNTPPSRGEPRTVNILDFVAEPGKTNYTFSFAIE